MGAIAGSWFGLVLGDELGKAVIPLMIVAGVAAGALWAGIVGVLKTRFNTNEIITSLMLNYVAINIAYYLIFNSRSTWRLLTGSGAAVPAGQAAARRRCVLAGADDRRHRDPARVHHSAPCARCRALGCCTARRASASRSTSSPTLPTRRATQACARGARCSPCSPCRAPPPVSVGSPTSATFATSSIRRASARRATATPASSSPHSPASTRSRWSSCRVLIGGLNNAGRSLQGPDFPAGLVGTLQGLILFFARRRRGARPLPHPMAHASAVAPREQQPARRHAGVGGVLRHADLLRRPRRGVRRTLRRAQPRASRE